MEDAPAAVAVVEAEEAGKEPYIHNLKRMDESISQKIDALSTKIDAIFISVEKTRKYFQWTMIITVLAILIPAVGLAIVIPSFMTTYDTGAESLYELGL